MTDLVPGAQPQIAYHEAKIRSLPSDLNLDPKPRPSPAEVNRTKRRLEERLVGNCDGISCEIGVTEGESN